MKITVRKAVSAPKPELEEEAPEAELESLGAAPASGDTSWLMTTEEEQQDALSAQKILAGKDRPPEIYFKDGESKTIRTRDNARIAMIWRYSVKIGKRYRQYTRPAEGETDLFMEKLGKKAALKAIYEVIDITGYVDKKTNKRQAGMARFLVGSTRLHEQFMIIKKKKGGVLNTFDIDVTRSGESTDTVYSLLPETPAPMRPEWRAQPRLSKDIAKYYSPPSLEEQKLIISQAAPDED
jgi:hypothetical protein